MNQVEALLRNEIGLDAASIGSTTIERAARLRMKLRGLKDVEDYHRLLKSSREERDELVEAVVVNETWFFRHRDSFTAFTRIALEWLGQNPVGPLRALSVPCSTGEEPYSMAMCLLDTNIPPERFNIDAVDVSARSLAAARLAIYGKNAFRGNDLAYRDKYFLPGKRGHVLNDAVRSCVRFQQDNLLAGRFLLSRDPYHFIFCRNVLIYFDRPTQRRVIEALHAKLSSSGLLFVGPAEVPIVLDNGFESANLDMAFACRKAAQIAGPKRREGRTGRTRTIPAPSTPVVQPAQAAIALNGRSQNAVSSTSEPGTEAAEDLETARKLADAGKLSEAGAICEAHIRQQGPTAQAYFLLGLVHDAGGDPRAADYYRKALYLDPEHHDALWHMALLLKKNGQDAEASGFKRRAERAQKK